MRRVRQVCHRTTYKGSAASLEIPSIKHGSRSRRLEFVVFTAGCALEPMLARNMPKNLGQIAALRSEV